jgi:hypothetical protein
MCYYEVTIYLMEPTGYSTTFKIDEKEIHEFLRFITDHVENLFIFNVVRHTISQ